MEEQDKFNFEDKDKRTKHMHDFKINDTVIGLLIEINEGTYGHELMIETPEKELITVGSYTALDGKLKNSDIGKAIKIVYTGDAKSKVGKSYMAFDVYVK